MNKDKKELNDLQKATSRMENIKYEVAQEIGLQNRKKKNNAK